MMRKNNTVKEIINVKVNGRVDTWLSREVSKYYTAGELHKNSKIYVDDINEQAMNAISDYEYSWLQVLVNDRLDLVTL